MLAHKNLMNSAASPKDLILPDPVLSASLKKLVVSLAADKQYSPSPLLLDEALQKTDYFFKSKQVANDSTLTLPPEKKNHAKPHVKHEKRLHGKISPAQSSTPTKKKKPKPKKLASKKAKHKNQKSKVASYSPSVTSPQIAKSFFTWNGSFENVVFVVREKPSETLGGDDRMSVDLGARLAHAMNITPRYVRREWLNTHPDHNDHLYITLNCRQPERRSVMSVGISNDLDCRMDFGVQDFYFNPHFNFSAGKDSVDQIVFPINTLPSRVTPQIIAAAASKYGELQPDGKPLIAIMLRRQRTSQMHSALRIAKSLADKHVARFALCTGPSAGWDVQESLDEDFWKIPGVLKYPWGQTPNPYLAILGAATHFVTSGTLSTTSDLLATGKPLYYMDDSYSSEGGIIRDTSDGNLRRKLFEDGVAQDFAENILDIPPPQQSIRTQYATEWDRISLEFVGTLSQFLTKRAVNVVAQSEFRPRPHSQSSMADHACS